MSKNQEVYPGTNERICLVKGRVVSLMMVMRMIMEKIQEKIEANHPADPFDLKGTDRCHEMKFVVPNTSTGMVIGKAEASIKEICEQTTANIQVYPKQDSAEAKQSSERVITVGHDRNDVLLAATHQILEKVVADPHHASGTDGNSLLSKSHESSGLGSGGLLDGGVVSSSGSSRGVAPITISKKRKTTRAYRAIKSTAMKEVATELRLPAKWDATPKMGKVIANLVPMKTPLSRTYDHLIEDHRECFHPSDVLQFNWKGQRVGLLVDFTDSVRYYSGSDVEKGGVVKYLKMPLERKRFQVPSIEEVQAFVNCVKMFFKELKEVPDNCHNLVAMHCTQGLDLVGFMLVSYLCAKETYSVKQALKEFAVSRPPGIKKRQFRKVLLQRYARKEEAAKEVAFPISTTGNPARATQQQASAIQAIGSGTTGGAMAQITTQSPQTHGSGDGANVAAQKRATNSQNGGPASKKANMNNSGGQSGPDVVQIKVPIPSAAVGALIGKGGEAMRNLKNESNCRVQMSKNQEVYPGSSASPVNFPPSICISNDLLLDAMRYVSRFNLDSMPLVARRWRRLLQRWEHQLPQRRYIPLYIALSVTLPEVSFCRLSIIGGTFRWEQYSRVLAKIRGQKSNDGRMYELSEEALTALMPMFTNLSVDIITLSALLNCDARVVFKNFSQLWEGNDLVIR